MLDNIPHDSLSYPVFCSTQAGLFCQADGWPPCSLAAVNFCRDVL